jgi:hypothetical protein
MEKIIIVIVCEEVSPYGYTLLVDNFAPMGFADKKKIQRKKKYQKNHHHFMAMSH